MSNKISRKIKRAAGHRSGRAILNRNFKRIQARCAVGREAVEILGKGFDTDNTLTSVQTSSRSNLRGALYNRDIVGQSADGDVTYFGSKQKPTTNYSEATR